MIKNLHKDILITDLELDRYVQVSIFDYIGRERINRFGYMSPSVYISYTIMENLEGDFIDDGCIYLYNDERHKDYIEKLDDKEVLRWLQLEDAISKNIKVEYEFESLF